QLLKQNLAPGRRIQFTMSFCDPLFLLVCVPCLSFYILSRRYAPAKDRWHQIYLLLVGVVFYCIFDIRHSLILLAIGIVNFWGGIVIGRESDERARRWLLILVVCLTLLPLLFYKYTDFSIQGASDIARFFGINTIAMQPLNIALPVG